MNRITASTPSLQAPVTATPGQPATKPGNDATISYEKHDNNTTTAYITLADKKADIRISVDKMGEFVATVNGVKNKLNMENSKDNKLVITTGRFDDKIIVDDNVKTFFDIETRDGNDKITIGKQAGAHVDAGAGNDEIKLGAGGTAEGGLGDDELTAGTGWNRLLDSAGNNKFITGLNSTPLQTYIETSGTSSKIYALSGEANILAHTGTNTINVLDAHGTITLGDLTKNNVIKSPGNQMSIHGFKPTDKLNEFDK